MTSKPKQDAWEETPEAWVQHCHIQSAVHNSKISLYEWTQSGGSILQKKSTSKRGVCGHHRSNCPTRKWHAAQTRCKTLITLKLPPSVATQSSHLPRPNKHPLLTLTMQNTTSDDDVSNLCSAILHAEHKHTHTHIKEHINPLPPHCPVFCIPAD